MSTLTCVTYGVVIDSSLCLLYIVLYDTQTSQRYPCLDNTTVTVTLILALLWGFGGIMSMVGNIVWPPRREREGRSERIEE